jgi:hypothetical protein
VTSYALQKLMTYRQINGIELSSVPLGFRVELALHGAPAEVLVCSVCPVLLFSRRSALGESGLTAKACSFEEETSAASLLHRR